MTLSNRVLSALVGLLTTTLIPACGDAGAPPEPIDGGPPVAPDAQTIDWGADAGPPAPPEPSLEAAVAQSRIRVVEGGTVAVTISVVGESLTGDLSIWFEALPTGVTATPLSFSSALDSADIVVEATSAAAQGGPWPAEIHVAADDTPSLEVVLPIEVVVAGTPGSLDSTFGSAGVAVLPARIGMMKLDVDSDGFTVIAGTRWDDPDTTEIDERPAIVRFQPNGLPDIGFGNDGLALGPAGGRVFVDDVAARADAVYLAMAQRAEPGGEESMVRRFQMDGSLDASFGSGGELAAPGGDLVVTPRGLVVVGRNEALPIRPSGPSVAISAPDPLNRSGRGITRGDELLIGTTGDTTRALVPIAGLFDGSGGEIATYGSNGEAVVGFIPIGSVVWTRPLGALEDGSTYVHVSYRTSSFEVFDGVVRLGPGGVVDGTFGSAGYVMFGSEGSRILGGVVDRRGRVVVAGTTTGPTGSTERHVVRFTEDGRIDGTFADGGTLVFEVGETAVEAIARDSVSDRVVLCGRASGTTRQCIRIWL